LVFVSTREFGETTSSEDINPHSTLNTKPLPAKGVVSIVAGNMSAPTGGNGRKIDIMETSSERHETGYLAGSFIPFRKAATISQGFILRL